MIKETEIKIYDVLLTHRKVDSISPEAWLLAPSIRFFTNSYYNHIDIVVEVLGEKWVMGAVAGGFIPHTRLEDWLAQYPKRREFAVLRYDWSELKEADVYQHLRQLAGNKYDWNGTLGDGFIDAIKSKFFKKEHNWNKRKQNADKVNCSEGIAYVFDMPESYKAIPKDIYEYQLFKVLFESRYNDLYLK